MNNRIQLGSFLACIALLIGIASLLFAAEVSAGPTIGAFACLLAIVARIIQAGGQHQEHMRWRSEDLQADRESGV